MRNGMVVLLVENAQQSRSNRCGSGEFQKRDGRSKPTLPAVAIEGNEDVDIPVETWVTQVSLLTNRHTTFHSTHLTKGSMSGLMRAK